MLLDKKYQKKQLFCPKCDSSFGYKIDDNHLCPECGNKLEFLEGFFEQQNSLENSDNKEAKES